MARTSDKREYMREYQRARRARLHPERKTKPVPVEPIGDPSGWQPSQRFQAILDASAANPDRKYMSINVLDGIRSEDRKRYEEMFGDK